MLTVLAVTMTMVAALHITPTADTTLTAVAPGCNAVPMITYRPQSIPPHRRNACRQPGG
jgi:hypothetical protein